jgi:hypothetical protein
MSGASAAGAYACFYQVPTLASDELMTEKAKCKHTVINYSEAVPPCSTK